MDFRKSCDFVKLLNFWILLILLLSKNNGGLCSAFSPKSLLRRECSGVDTGTKSGAVDHWRGNYNYNRPAVKKLRMRRGNNYRNNKKIEQDWNNIFSEDGTNNHNQKKRKSDKMKVKTATTMPAGDVSHPDRTLNRERGNENFQDEQQGNLKKTLPGGQSLLFEMARKLFVWEFNDDQEYDGKSLRKSLRQRDSEGNILLPRWRPYKGVSNDNVEFRSSAPRMTTEGYARAILRHARKRNPSMWKQALRIYDKTAELERQFSAQQVYQGNNPTINNMNNITSMAPTTATTSKGFARTTLHYVGALVACSKLGLWKQAFEIFNDAQNNPSIQITEGMILSLLRACVRASYGSKYDNEHGRFQNSGCKQTMIARRAPLHAAKEFLLKLERDYGMSMDPVFVNPLAAAYQSIGDYNEAEQLINDLLSSTKDLSGDQEGTVNQKSCRKDGVSYSLLVKSRAASGDWSSAVEHLKLMTEAGMYPVSRDLNSWKEVSSRKSRVSLRKKRRNVWILHRSGTD